MTSDRLLKDALIPVHGRRGIGFNMSESVQVLVKRLESSAAPFPCGLTQTLLISTPRFRRNALYSLPICRRSEKLRITPLGGWLSASPLTIGSSERGVAFAPLSSSLVGVNEFFRSNRTAA
jgi:hypothetical protein